MATWNTEQQAKIDNIDNAIADAKEKAEKAIADAAEFEKKRVESHNQLDQMIKALDEKIEEQKACCEQQTAENAKLKKSIADLQDFVSKINNHDHDVLQAGDLFLGKLTKMRNNAIVAKHKKNSRKYKSANFNFTTEGKLKRIFEAFEEWLMPYLHMHEATEEAAKETAEKICAERTKEAKAKRAESLEIIAQLEQAYPDASKTFNEISKTLTEDFLTNTELKALLKSWEDEQSACNNDPAAKVLADIEACINKRYLEVINNKEFKSDGTTDGDDNVKLTKEYVLNLAKIFGLPKNLS